MPETLSRRTILRYNRLQQEVAALATALRAQKNATASPATVRLINAAHDLAERVFARTPDIPRFKPLPEDAALTHYDTRMLVHQLAGACFAFEELQAKRRIAAAAAAEASPAKTPDAAPDESNLSPVSTPRLY